MTDNKTNIDPSKDYKILTDSEILKVNELRYDIYFLKKQIDMCEHWIKFGNWDGYNENLKARKQRLERMRSEYVNLIKELNKYTT